MPWIKSKTSQLDDPRIARLSDPAQLAYYKLNLLAGKCDADGAFVMNDEQLTEDEIAFFLRMDVKKLNAAMKELKKNKLIYANGRGPALTDWNEDQVSQAARQERWRLRQQRHRDVTRDEEDVTDASQSGHAPRVKNQRKNQRKNQKRKDLPTPTPSSPRKKSASGRQAGSKSKSDSNTSSLKEDRKIESLKGAQRKRADLAVKVLGSCGLRNPKLNSIAVILAIRNYKTNDDMLTDILAAVASSYSDDRVKSKEAVAAYRIENDQVPQSYNDPKLWRSVPVKALNAAGIEDLDRYIRTRDANKWGVEH